VAAIESGSEGKVQVESGGEHSDCANDYANDRANNYTNNCIYRRSLHQDLRRALCWEFRRALRSVNRDNGCSPKRSWIVHPLRVGDARRTRRLQLPRQHQAKSRDTNRVFRYPREPCEVHGNPIPPGLGTNVRDAYMVWTKIPVYPTLLVCRYYRLRVEQGLCLPLRY
jgi:hypothetical protein